MYEALTAQTLRTVHETNRGKKITESDSTLLKNRTTYSLSNAPPRSSFTGLEVTKVLTEDAQI